MALPIVPYSKILVESIRNEDWRQFAREPGYGARYVLTRVRVLAIAVPDALTACVDALAGQGCEYPRLERTAQVIAAQTQRIHDTAV